ncbi:MAG: PEP-CTERM sorting domain-containing protein, partial [Planctomycetes bacterium]|nr:PEP-CTERM sorting domain-containing protein [Planctomycetota bacterium]
VPPPPPNGVPEPATMVSALIGLAAAAGYGLKRRGAKTDEKSEQDAPKTE